MEEKVERIYSRPKMDFYIFERRLPKWVASKEMTADEVQVRSGTSDAQRYSSIFEREMFAAQKCKKGKD